jgi:hypothetical protein
MRPVTAAWTSVPAALPGMPGILRVCVANVADIVGAALGLGAVRDAGMDDGVIDEELRRVVACQTMPYPASTRLRNLTTGSGSVSVGA